MTLKLGIIGHGFVGKVIDHGFSIDVEKKLVDPIYGTSVKDLEDFKPEIAFIAVPTPMGDDGGINGSILLQCAHEVTQLSSRPILVIKSTVTPDVLAEVTKVYDRVVYNPEFMRERFAKEDFINPPMHVLGGEKQLCNEVEAIYARHSICKEAPVYKCDIASASLVKYTLNSFLATKVLFFNQLKEVFDASNTKTSWEEFTGMVTNDPRIGKSHVSVPGPDGRQGFGGACFAKDAMAILSYASQLDAPFTVLEKAINENQKYRQQYSELDDREKQQSVRYDVHKEQ